MLEQKVKAAWRAFIAAKDPSADVSERAWEDLHFTERNAWFSAFRAFVVPTDDPQPVPPEGPMAETVEQAARDVAKCLNERDGQGLDLRHVAMLVHYAQQPVQEVEHCLWARNGNSRCPVPQEAQPLSDEQRNCITKGTT